VTKLKSPALSLGAKGTLGDTITFQRRLGTNFAREKPIPTDPRSLAQIYQRWDYQNGISYWNTLSNAQKQTYKTAASRHHMTGFAYFMRYYLNNLPDILARWRLDGHSGAIAPDSSKNNYNGIVVGASPVTGYIDGAYYFDGLNDRITCGFIPTNTITAYTVLIWFKTTIIAGIPLLTNDRTAPIARGSLFLGLDINRIYHWNLTTTGPHLHQPAQVYNDNLWHLVAYRYNGTIMETFYDNINLGNFACTGTLIQPTADTMLGARDDIPVSSFYTGDEDHVLFFTRALSDADLTRHFERRYPL